MNRCKAEHETSTHLRSQNEACNGAMWGDVCGLSVEKFHEFRDDLLGRFFHEPVS
jgi:hypothetical protein